MLDLPLMLVRLLVRTRSKRIAEQSTKGKNESDDIRGLGMALAGSDWNGMVNES